MYHRIQGESLNEIVYLAIKSILKDGIKMNTRNGEAEALYNVDLILTNPKARHLCLRGRTNNIFGTLGEMFWVLAGEKEISPHLEFFVPRAKNYSDDGKTWNASYGDRLWNYGQFDHIFNIFKDDGLYTRRATQSIFVPGFDTYSDYLKREGTMKDIPCNQWINYFVVPENGVNRLFMKTCQRSGDIIFGTGNINIPEFTIIQEMVLSELRQMFPNEVIELGHYIQSVTNLHLYDMTLKQGEDINSAFQGDLLSDSKKDDVSAIFYANAPRDMFKELYNFQRDKIQSNISETTVEEIFKKYDVRTELNTLYYYAKLVDDYIISKQLGGTKDNKVSLKDVKYLKEIQEKTPGLYQSVLNSGFRPFSIEE